MTVIISRILMMITEAYQYHLDRAVARDRFARPCSASTSRELPLRSERSKSLPPTHARLILAIRSSAYR